MIKINRVNFDVISSQYLSKLKTLNRSRKLPIRSYYIDNFDRIILAKPQEFQGIILEFRQLYRNANASQITAFKKYMKNQYTSEINKYGNWLSIELGIMVCPYCNRQYTFTVNTPTKKTRPQFDHFNNKSDFPFFALSFYNLIPSCPTCNLLKLQDVISVHPYVEGFETNCRFEIENIENLLLTENSTSNNWRIVLNHNGNIRYNSNINSFALTELYNQHKDYVSEIVVKARSYNEGYYDSLIETFTNLNLTSSEMDTLIFGTYLELSKHEKRPLSKLTKDIVEDILNRRY